MDTLQSVMKTFHLGRSSGGGEGGAPPREPTSDEVQSLREKYDSASQSQVFTFWDALSPTEKAVFFEQLSSIDPAHVNAITERALNPAPSQPANQTEKKAGDDEGDTEQGEGTAAAAATAATSAELAPLPDSATASILDSSAADLEGWYAAGLDLIAANKVAVVLMAGGQGTRLGSSAPKGCFDIGLPSGKSLFQIQAERIRRVQRLAERRRKGAQTGGGDEAAGAREKVVVPWYVMTSGPTRAPTESFFEEKGYFGLDKENVVVFEQGVLPCISNEGKILLEGIGKVAVAPDGNGGLYQALVTSNVIADMRARGIAHIHAYCVDNCLVRVADPTFIGFAAAKRVSIATKVVRKRSASESVGLILRKNGKPDVVEYSEIDRATAEARDPRQPDVLKFRAANIVNHYYSFAFLDSIPEWAHRLPHHVARKKIPYIDTAHGARGAEQQQQVRPEAPNGIKLEQFVFDVFPMLELDAFACLEVRREDEFSPLKNKSGTGEDDPQTSRRDILDQGRRWCSAAGATVVSKGDEQGVEVSPLISYGGESLEKLSGKEITAPAVLEKELSSS